MFKRHKGGPNKVPRQPHNITADKKFTIQRIMQEKTKESTTKENKIFSQGDWLAGACLGLGFFLRSIFCIMGFMGSIHLSAPLRFLCLLLRLLFPNCLESF
jgi:hypothetical protein